MEKPRTKEQVEKEIASLELMFEIAGEIWDQARQNYNELEWAIMKRKGELVRIEEARKSNETSRPKRSSRGSQPH